MADMYTPDTGYSSAFDDDDSSSLLKGLLSPADAHSLVMPPPSTAPKTSAGQTTPQTGSIATAPSQSQPKVSGPAMIPGMAGKPEDLQGGLSAIPAAAQPSVVPDALNMRTQQDQAKLAQLQNAPAGGSQIQNRWGRIAARIGDVAGSVLAPNVTQYVPGSTLNKQRQVGIQQGVVSSDQGQQQARAGIEDQSQLAAQRAAKAQQDLADAQRDQPRKPTTGEVSKYDLDPDATYSDRELGKMAIEANKPGKGGSLQDAYGSAVQDAISRGVDPGKDPKVQQYADAITSLQRQPTAKEPGREDKAIAIYAKSPKDRTPDENAFIQGYEKDVNVTKTAPGVARTSVLLQMPIGVADPSVPGGVRYVTRKNAIGQEAPSSSTVRVPARVLEDFTSGADAKTSTRLNTSYDHLNRLGQVSDALQNNNVRVLNQLANAWATETGQPAPTNFEAVKAAVAGEVAGTFKGSGATDEEIAQIAKAINSKNSPAELKGVINEYRGLIGSKRDELKKQFDQGIQGKPALSSNNQAPLRAGYIRVQLPGQPPGQIPAAQKNAFLVKNKGARILQDAK